MYAEKHSSEFDIALQWISKILQPSKAKNGNCACTEFERSKEESGKDRLRFDLKLHDLRKPL